MNSPLFAIALALHVASAVTGFATLAITGWYASAARQAPRGRDAERLRRYFRAGRNWAARALLLVPVFGGALLALGHGADATHAWPWIGLAIWIAASGVASALVWPGERAIQAAIAAGSLLAGEPPDLPADACRGQARSTTTAGTGSTGDAAPPLAEVCRRVERAAAATSLLFVTALVVMLVQPG